MGEVKWIPPKHVKIAVRKPPKARAKSGAKPNPEKSLVVHGNRGKGGTQVSEPSAAINVTRPSLVQKDTA